MDKEDIYNDSYSYVLTGNVEDHERKCVITIGELLVVGFILAAWICAIALFLHKWSQVRISHTPNYRFNHCPKNLDTIKVVKHPTDSVIHHPCANTILASTRRRLKRTNTCPNIRMNFETETENNGHKPKHKHKLFRRSMTSPVLVGHLVVGAKREDASSILL